MSSLVAARRDRVLAAMAEREIDVLVLGRQDDANYASGMHRLWTAGTRPFGAGCLVVRSTGRTHVLSGWDAGLPETMSWDDLYPSTWNPRVMTTNLAAIPGLTDAQRVGVDEVSPSFGRAIGRLAPDAEVVPADDLMAAVRRHKLPGEVEKIRAACAIAAAAVGEIAHERSAAALAKALGRRGVTIPSSAITVDADRFDVGVIIDGYEGGCAGAFGGHDGASSLVDACRPGATHAELARAAESERWLIRGLGMGFERPVFDPTHGVDDVIEPGMVLSVGDGADRSIIHVGDPGNDTLSQRPPEHS